MSAEQKQDHSEDAAHEEMEVDPNMPVFEEEDEIVPNADFKMDVEVVESQVPVQVGMGFVDQEASEPKAAETKPKASAKKSAKKSISKGKKESPAKKTESPAKKTESPAKASQKTEKS